MTQDEIPREEWPADGPLKWQKRQHKKNKNKRKYYFSTCIRSCKLFVKNPPPGIIIYTEHVIIEKNKIRIPFGVEAKGYYRLGTRDIDFENSIALQ